MSAVLCHDATLPHCPSSREQPRDEKIIKLCYIILLPSSWPPHHVVPQHASRALPLTSQATEQEWQGGEGFCMQRSEPCHIKQGVYVTGVAIIYECERWQA